MNNKLASGLQLLIIVIWAYLGPFTAFYWLGTEYGPWLAVFWLVLLIFLIRVDLFKRRG
jgi:hypothetical protein